MRCKVPSGPCLKPGIGVEWFIFEYLLFKILSFFFFFPATVLVASFSTTLMVLSKKARAAALQAAYKTRYRAHQTREGEIIVEL
jgi:hypothetical protein